jgi:hypothetical protein
MALFGSDVAAVEGAGLGPPAAAATAVAAAVRAVGAPACAAARRGDGLYSGVLRFKAWASGTLEQ